MMTMFMFLAIVAMILSAGLFTQSLMGGAALVGLGCWLAYLSETNQAAEERFWGVFFFIAVVGMAGGALAGLWALIFS